MQEMLDFVEQQILLGMFIGLNTSDTDEQVIYTVDYWEVETATDSLGVEVNIKAGKQKTFTL
ncbi:hypothetical protein VPH1254_0018 [Vibrio phage 1254]|nr:hypothetical protein SIPHO018v1_100018 [Vibrio phage 11E33.1]QZI86710.1 hypothetical protein SIPHO019v1_10002 [Vibrio phage 82E32.1]QZI92578.1 hypothetical protein SIPHO017v1_p0045 [Vibrio phage 19E33.1]QZI92811.1 hypothetical protein SIPHO016v1_p0032 [Vibrio phage 38E33.6a]QZI92999.1 hypothetical protein SIPHO015v1_p0061 [Vibrio phage 82E32.2]QZI93044.1 hypothetical protein SIPHO014v1_p0045 [Vibrio phage 82E32.3]QZI93091.1 hypothetical protein SIPHO013v1_p0030 [Vibrio phage 82E33.2]